jgi:prepilin-type N-terminal cleavage/methylation domain-containing protein
MAQASLTTEHRVEHGLGGFSLAELVCVIVIIGMAAAIAVPRYSSAIALRRVEAAARRIVVDLALAQRHAKNSNVSQTVMFTGTTGLYELVGMSHPDHAAEKYEVHLGEDPYRVEVVSVDFGGDQEIVFDVYGVPDSGGSVLICAGSCLRTIAVDAETGRADAQ